ncbi:calmodulin [Agaribacter marinus]|uniref:EF-hand domain-containing protein n=1 Tax=Agaribacter marinus TaxID=1431249 RepID=A0AA37WHY3_9ALTE|nr:calmodulin [Agaribacter marinus]GLR69094.1 hypothetical protein GCM10007852_00020 [Agaribacter marinus]
MSIFTKKTLIGSFLVVASAASFASSDLFDSLDVDKSGSISSSEASVHSVLSEMFATLDENADGELSYDEFAKAGLE